MVGMGECAPLPLQPTGSEAHACMPCSQTKGSLQDPACMLFCTVAPPHHPVKRSQPSTARATGTV